MTMRQKLALLVLFCSMVTLLLIFSAHIRVSTTTTDTTGADVPRSLRGRVSFMPQSGLGNVVCEYAHLLHTNVTFSAEAFLHPKMHQILSRLFSSFPLPLLPASHQAQMLKHNIQYFDALAEFEAGSLNLLRTSVMLTGAPCRVSLLWPLRDYWRKKLTFKPELKLNGAQRLRRLLKKNVHNWPVENAKAVVGVHVRRGDFTSVLKRRYPGKELLPSAYYHSAFAYYRQRYGREVVFVVITEKKTRAWCREFLSSPLDDVIVVDDDASAEQDLVQVSMFEHIVYSHGTFGLWAILLSDARSVVYPDAAADTVSRRYSHHRALDFIADKVPGTEFVTVSF